MLLLTPAICPAAGAPATSRPDNVAKPSSSMPDLSKGSATPKELLEKIHATFPATDHALVPFYDPRYQRHARATLEIRDKMVARVKAVADVVEAQIGKAQADGIRRSADWFGAGRKMPSPLQPAVVGGKVDWTKVIIKEERDTASFSVTDQELYFGFVKVNGKWYIAYPEAGPGADHYLAEGQKHLDAALAGMETFEKKVKAGKVTKSNFDQEWKSVFAGEGATTGPE
jgi:hypothetical protein